MITIIYDARNGIAIPDGQISDVVDSIVESGRMGRDETHMFSTSIVIDALRLAVKEKRINHDQIVFSFNNQTIRVDPFGNLEQWPEGFCDLWTKILIELIDWDA